MRMVDRGSRGGSILVLLLAGTTLSTIGDGSIQVLLAPLLESQGLSRGTIGPVVSAYSVAALSFRFVGGSWFRGPKAYRLIPIGSLLSACSFFLLPTSTSPLVLASIIALNGAGFALVSTGGLVAVMEARSGDSAGSIMSWYTGFIGAGYAVAGFTGGVIGDWLGLEAGIRVLALVPMLTALIMVVALRRVPTPPMTVIHDEAPSVRWVGRFKNLGPIVWLAFFVGVHINLLNGVLVTFFPLFGLTIGLSLTGVGVLTGIHSAAASLIRFAAPLVFRVITPRRSLPWFVVLGGVAVATLTISPRFWVLAAAWCVIGLSRGVLRVSSAALLMESSGDGRSERGPSSGIYMAGLDVGRIIGPLVGGLGVQSLGFTSTFTLAGLGFPLVFLAMNIHLGRRDTADES
jgi:MFS family permease